MSGSLNIYPFEDTQTSIRFGVQVCLFLIGLAITNKMIIQPALKLQAERKKRTTGNQLVAQTKLKQAEELEKSYQSRLNEALEKARTSQAEQIKKAKESAATILENAQQKSSDYMIELRNNLKKEKEEAASQIHLHIQDLVNRLYSKLGVKT